MHLIISVFITDKKLNSERCGHTKNRLEVFKYMLASYSILDFNKVYIYCKLDNVYQKEQENLIKYINKLFHNPIITFDRFINKVEWNNSNIFDNFKENELILFTQNDDHIFMDSDINTIKEGIDILNKSNKKYKSLYYSHYPEINNLCKKLKAKSIGNYYSFNIPMTDSIQIFNIKFLKYLLLEITWPHNNMIRIDELIRDNRIWNKYGNGIFDIDIITIVPKKECFRHFDGYSHVNIDETICPPLKIPPNFFEKEVIINYCNKNYNVNAVNINPLKELYIPNKTKDLNNVTDYKYLITDIPLFWKKYIKKIEICDNIDEKILTKHRNIYYNRLDKCRHINWWTNGIIYDIINIKICLSIKNRVKNLRELIPQINLFYEELLNTNYKVSVNITDFQSNDCNIEEEIGNLKCEYSLEVKDENFNLGKGWNNSANMNVTNDDILLFLTNDIYIKNIGIFFNDLKNNTIKNKAVFSPEHLCEDKNNNYSFNGGATCFCVYKDDFIKMGNFPESECWGMAGVIESNGKNNGEDGWFFNTAIENNLKLNNSRSNNIIARWHPREQDNPWYKNSIRAKNARHFHWWKQ